MYGQVLVAGERYQYELIEQGQGWTPGGPERLALAVPRNTRKCANIRHSIRPSHTANSPNPPTLPPLPPSLTSTSSVLSTCPHKPTSIVCPRSLTTNPPLALTIFFDSSRPKRRPLSPAQYGSVARTVSSRPLSNVIHI